MKIPIKLLVIAVLAVFAQSAAIDAATAATPATSAVDSDLPPLRVAGNVLMAGDRVIRLRGLDWGWWHLMGTQYSEADMKNVAKWGGNVVRLSFSYNDLETDDNPPAWKADGFKDVDDVAQWAKNAGIYVILDMHVVPGGQSDAPYCDHGRNLLWTDADSQARFVALWAEIARHYRDHPEVAAYELVNEPGSPQKTPDLLRAIDQRAIDAIRAVDPNKIIVVGGDRGSGPADLTAAMKFTDPNILYTFHWYVGAGGNEDWISTDRQEPGLSGTSDWTKIEKTFTAPAGADHMSALFRSLGNTGSAWFDDVVITDDAGHTLLSNSYDDDTQQFQPEALPETMSFDSSIGHDKPGSLKVHDSTKFNDWAGWVSKRLSIQPGHQYHISAWVKLDQATGDTYQGAMFFRVKTQLDPDLFEKRIAPAIAFAKKYNVPLWVGEFGCYASERDLQVQWVAACTSLFEKNDFSWTYWNDKETSSPNGMGLQAERSDGSNLPVNERLLAVLRAGWAKNAGSVK